MDKVVVAKGNAVVVRGVVMGIAVVALGVVVEVAMGIGKGMDMDTGVDTVGTSLRHIPLLEGQLLVSLNLFGA